MAESKGSAAESPALSTEQASFATRLIHGDGSFQYDSSGRPLATGLAPDLSFSSTFEVQPGPFETQNVYSRVTAPTRNRVEHLLGQLEDPTAHAVTYSSGLSAAFAALTHYNPKRVAIDKGYHGTHDVIQVSGFVNFISFEDFRSVNVFNVLWF